MDLVALLGFYVHTYLISIAYGIRDILWIITVIVIIIIIINKQKYK